MLKMHVLETVINTIKYITRTYIFQAILKLVFFAILPGRSLKLARKHPQEPQEPPKIKVLA